VITYGFRDFFTAMPADDFTAAAICFSVSVTVCMV
jgi:hypothetical protein